MEPATKQIVVVFILMGCMVASHARPFHDKTSLAAPDFMMQIINMVVIQEFLGDDDSPCQSVQDYSQDDVTSGGASDNYDESLIIFGGYEEMITTDIVVDEPRQRRRRHMKSKRGNRRRHSRRNKQRHAHTQLTV